MQADSCVFTALWQERSFNESRWQIGGRGGGYSSVESNPKIPNKYILVVVMSSL